MRLVLLVLAVLFVTVMGPGVTSASDPQHPSPTSAAGVRTRLSAALGLPRDATGVSKCGFAMCVTAYRERRSATGARKTMIETVLTRTELQKSRTLGRFTVHYDTSTSNTPAMLDAAHNRIPGSAEEFVDSVLSIANSVYDFEVGTLGYAPPPPDGTAGGGPEYDIYVVDLGLEYGETTPETALDSKSDGERYTSYLTIDNDFIFVTPDSNRGLPALRVTIAHEFHHAIQMGSYGLWSAEVYFHEITSTWMETMMYPSVTDYMNYLRASWSHFRNPSTPFTSNDLIMYSRSIWGIYLTGVFGRDIMREIWEDIRNEGPLAANTTVLARHGTNFPSAFCQWNVWNYYTGGRARPDQYYPNGAVYPLIAATGLDLSGSMSQVTYDGVLPSLSARYYEVAPGGDTAAVVVSNLDASTALNPVVPQRPYTITLGKVRADESYESVIGGWYYAMTYDDPSRWKSWVLAGNTSKASGLAEGIPFPDPFRNDGTTKLYIPADADAGTLHIYDNSMGLVFEQSVQAGSMFGRHVFSWDGRTARDRRASSGVYFYILELPGKTMRGKFVILRK
jgi:hypothetical protein